MCGCSATFNNLKKLKHGLKVALRSIMIKKQKTSQWAESNYIASVAEFHTKFRHPVLPNPTIPGKDRCALRVSLIAEVRIVL